MRDVISYTGAWERRSGEEYSAMTETSTVDANANARLQFVGGGIRWLGSCGPKQGRAQVVLDGERVATVDCSDQSSKTMQAIFVAEDLEYGAHTIEVKALSTGSGEADGVVSIDAFDILPASRTVN
jgi:hypothetical protein